MIATYTSEQQPGGVWTIWATGLADAFPTWQIPAEARAAFRYWAGYVTAQPDGTYRAVSMARQMFARPTWAYNTGADFASDSEAHAWIITQCERVLTAVLSGAALSPEWYSPVGAATATGTSESSWRNRAAAGQIPGAFKVGKQWVIPASAVQQTD